MHHITCQPAQPRNLPDWVESLLHGPHVGVQYLVTGKKQVLGARPLLVFRSLLLDLRDF